MPFSQSRPSLRSGALATVLIALRAVLIGIGSSLGTEIGDVLFSSHSPSSSFSRENLRGPDWNQGSNRSGEYSIVSLSPPSLPPPPFSTDCNRVSSITSRPQAYETCDPISLHTSAEARSCVATYVVRGCPLASAPMTALAGCVLIHWFVTEQRPEINHLCRTTPVRSPLHTPWDRRAFGSVQSPGTRLIMDDLTPVSSAARARSGTIIPILNSDDQSNEIYNIPSRRRQTLLNELGETLQTRTIPVPFWAGLQGGDLDVLEKMVEKARVAPEFIWVVAKYWCRHLPLLWLQKPPKNDNVPTTISASTSSSVFSSVDSDGRPTKKTRREHQPMGLASKREEHGCFLKHTEPKEMAHIYPHYLIHPRTEHAQRPFQFWDLLKIFWGPEKLARWRAQLFRNPDDPTEAADTIKNLICMSPEIHRMWSRAQFALRPLGYNHDKSELTLEWHWLPKEIHGFNDEVEVSKVPNPTMNLDSTTGKHNPVKLLIETDPNTSRRIKTGDRIIMTTSDPENLPLPDHELLDNSTYSSFLLWQRQQRWTTSTRRIGTSPWRAFNMLKSG